MSSKYYQYPYCNKQYSKESYKKYICDYAPSPLCCQSCGTSVKGMYFVFYHKRCSKPYSKHPVISRCSSLSSNTSINLGNIDPQVSQSNVLQISQSQTSSNLLSEVEFLRN